MTVLSLDTQRAGPRWRRLLWWLDTPRGWLCMFAVGLGIRLAIAPLVGFYGDLRLYRLWADRLNDLGFRHFYAPGYFADYPPGYLYVLWLLGAIQHTPSYLILKLPAIIGDLALAWVARVLALRLAPASWRERFPVGAVVAAAVLFNPAVIALSSVWGQVDVVPAALVLGALCLLLTGDASARRDFSGVLLFAVAIAMKPQAGFVFPAIGYVLFRRYLYRRPWPQLVQGASRLAVIGGVPVVVWLLSGVPFGLSPTGLINFYHKSSDIYPVTSASAYNMWGISGFWRGDSYGTRYSTIVTLFLGVPALYVGLVLFAVGCVVLVWRAHRSIEGGHDEARVMMAVAATMSLLAFTVLTRMHERYLFPAIAGLAPFLLWRAFRRLYAALSVIFIVNLWFPFVYYNNQWGVTSLRWEPLFVALYGDYNATDTTQRKLWCWFVLAACIILFLGGIRWAEHIDDLDDAPNSLTVDRAPWRRRLRATLATIGPAQDGRAGAVEPRQRAYHDALARARTAIARTRSSFSAVIARAPLHARGTVTQDVTQPTPVERERSDQPAWVRWLPLAVVLVACVFGLVVLHSELSSAHNLNDSAFHLEMVRWADHQLGEGRLPLDGWFPFLSLGSSFFHHYQSLPYTLSAVLARVTGAGDQSTYLWIQYLLLALWPISVYVGARLMGLGRWPAACAALVSPLIVSTPGYGYEHGSYTWQGYGLYTQLWAMWLLPLAWGLTWRAVSRGKSYSLAALALALTIALHLITGYLAVLSVFVWVIVAWRGVLARFLRAAIVVAGGLLTAAWVLVPLLADRSYAAQSEFYKGTIFNDSYGAGKILGWLFNGELFDSGRFPIVSLLVAAGFVVCVRRARKELSARALLGVWTLSVLLYFGRATWGSLVDVLPGDGDLQMHRFIIGVHLAGILLAGIGLFAVGRWVGRLLTRLVTVHWWRPAYAWVAVGAAVVGVLAPAWVERANYDRNDASLIAFQRASDASDGADLAELIAEAKSLGGGRIYAGLRGNWGRDYKVGFVPVYAELANADADAIGFTFRTVQSLSTDIEASFDETNPAQYEMLDIRYLILPSDRPPSVPATLLDARGNHKLYEVKTSGYFQVVDRIGSLKADRTNLAPATAGFRNSYGASRNVYPSVAFNGALPVPATIDGTPPATSPGSVLDEHSAAVDGNFGATVQLHRPAVVLLKESYDPRWQVTVDGVPAKPVFMAPSLVGVDVPAGTHVVRFHYRPYAEYPLLFAIGAVTLASLAAWPRRHWLVTAGRQLRARFPRRSDDERSEDSPHDSRSAPEVLPPPPG